MKTLKNIFAIITILTITSFNSFGLLAVSYDSCGVVVQKQLSGNPNVINVINIDCDKIKFVDNPNSGNYSVFICNSLTDWNDYNYGEIDDNKFNKDIDIENVLHIVVSKNNVEYRVKVTNTTANTTANKINLTELIVFPNPAVSNITVKFETTQSDMPISVYSLTGALVYRNEDTRIFGKNEVIINTEHLKPGVYLLSVGNTTQKFEVK
jgi:hypothetical protein